VLGAKSWLETSQISLVRCSLWKGLYPPPPPPVVMATADESKSPTAESCEVAASTYRSLVEHCPDVKRAWVSTSPDARGAYSIMVQRTVRDVEGDRNRTFLSTLSFSPAAGDAPASFDAASLFPTELPGEVLAAPSPSGRYLCVIRTRTPKSGKEQTFLDILDSGCVVSTVELTRYHGKVVGSPWFRCLDWNADETLVAYTATAKPKEASTFFTADKKAKNRGMKFEHQEDW